MMMQAASEAGDKRPRKIVVAKTAVAILVLLVVLVGHELRKSFGVTRLYNYLATNEQPLAVLPRTNVSRTEFVLMQPRNDGKSPEAKEEKPREFKDDDNNDDKKKKKLSKEDKAVLAERRNLEYAYKNQAERDARSTRFPAVDERVKLYMSNWYLPPCGDGDRVAYEFINSDDEFVVLLRELESLHGDPRLFRVNAQFDGSRATGVLDNVHFLNRTTMNATCSHRYCKDFMEFLFPALDHLDDAIGATTMTEIRTAPILYQFGDSEKTKAPLNTNPRERGSYPAVPVVKKIRQALTVDELQRVTMASSNGDPNELCGAPQPPIVLSANEDDGNHLQPIVFKLKTQRHYSRIYQVADADVPWDKKRNSAIFRGALTGPSVANKTLSDSERCQLIPRCRLVFNHDNSTLVDAKLAKPFANLKGIPESLDGIPLYGDTLSLEEMLRYKALIMLEGNDVSSGLKWALFSNSVVLMPAPTFTSWAMEELLQPWVHYIPIKVAIKNTTSTTGGDKVTVTDVEEKMQWVLDHDKEAREIARAGKLWISDLVLHPEAASDERAIFNEIVRRYRTHFAVADGLSET